MHNARRMRFKYYYDNNNRKMRGQFSCTFCELFSQNFAKPAKWYFPWTFESETVLIHILPSIKSKARRPAYFFGRLILTRDYLKLKICNELISKEYLEKMFNKVTFHCYNLNDMYCWKYHEVERTHLFWWRLGILKRPWQHFISRLTLSTLSHNYTLP